MMMRAILHLGTYKTGTSSIQNFLYKNRDILADHGILYPTTGIARQEHVGFRHYHLVKNYTQDGGRHSLPIALVNEISSSGCNTIIISAEAFSSLPHISSLSGLTAALEDIGIDDISAVVFFRNIAAYAVRHYRQYVVNQRLKIPYALHARKPVVFNYLFLTQYYRGVFGEKLTPLIYEDSSDVRASFLDATRIDVPFDALAVVEKANVNSFSALEIESIRCANELGLEHAAALDRLDLLKSDAPELFDINWTERFEGDIPTFSRGYCRRLSAASGWDMTEVQFLLTPPEVNGQNVSALSPRLIQLIEGSSSSSVTGN